MFVDDAKGTVSPGRHFFILIFCFDALEMTRAALRFVLHGLDCDKSSWVFYFGSFCPVIISFSPALNEFVAICHQGEPMSVMTVASWFWTKRDLNTDRDFL